MPEEVVLAKEVVHWHLFSDKTTDPKPAMMSLEEAESIIFIHENKLSKH